VTVPAALAALKVRPFLRLTLIGDERQIKPLLSSVPAFIFDRIDIVHTDVAISSQDRPDSVLRGNRDSSMFLAIDQIRQGLADACVSAGNTGALLMAGRHLLKTIPGIDKPAIMATLPATRSGGYSYLLDVGANVSNNAAELYQFALMGAVLASSLSDRPRARVALLNIGEEAHKGTREIRAAARLLADCPDVNYIGFIEGNQLFDGVADVIVCDGFTGNITIKASAGAVKVIQRLILGSLNARWYYRLLALLARPLLADIRHELSPSRYNGATLVGLRGIIVKSHGNALRDGFERAISHAIKQIEDDVPALIAGRMKSCGYNKKLPAK
jgi:glycerol-3-phosphate acyltransferase PlsX